MLGQGSESKCSDCCFLLHTLPCFVGGWQYLEWFHIPGTYYLSCLLLWWEIWQSIHLQTSVYLLEYSPATEGKWWWFQDKDCGLARIWSVITSRSKIQKVNAQHEAAPTPHMYIACILFRYGNTQAIMLLDGLWVEDTDEWESLCLIVCGN